MSKKCCVKSCVARLVGGLVFGAGVAALVYAGWHPASFAQGGFSTIMQLTPEFMHRVLCYSFGGAALVYWSLCLCCGGKRHSQGSACCTPAEGAGDKSCCSQ